MVSDGTVLRVVATWDMPGTTIAQNVYHVETAFVAPVAAADVVTDLTDWVETMAADILGSLADTVDLNEVEVSELTSTGPAVWESIGAELALGAGLAATDALPNGVAMVVRAGLAGVSWFARKYLAGMGVSKVDSDNWEAGALAEGADFLVTWLAGHNGGAGIDYLPGIFAVATEAFRHLSTTGAVSVIPGYQRRRKPGVGI